MVPLEAAEVLFSRFRLGAFQEIEDAGGSTQIDGFADAVKPGEVGGAGLLLAGAGALLLGDGLLLGRFVEGVFEPGAVRHTRQREDQHREGDDAGGEEAGQGRAAPDPLDRPLPPPRRPRLHRLVRQEPAQVLGQRLGARIALRRTFLQALQADRFEVAGAPRLKATRRHGLLVQDLKKLNGKPIADYSVSPFSGVKIETSVDHIDHICQLAGTSRHCAIGSDLDGGYGTEQTPMDLDSIADLQSLTTILARRGYSESDIAGIMHGNWIRKLSDALPS